MYFYTILFLLVNDRHNDLSTFDQSGEFASELHEIQREIDSSSSLTLLNIADLLETKRRLNIFQVYFTISCLIPNSFLMSKNQTAFNHIYSRSKPILKQFVGDYEHLRPIHVMLPSPLIAVQPYAKRLYPWIVYEYENNVNAKRLWWSRCALMDPINLCLVGLKPQELTQANTELVSVQVMLQNIDDVIRKKTTMNTIGTILRSKPVCHSYKSFY